MQIRIYLIPSLVTSDVAFASGRELINYVAALRVSLYLDSPLRACVRCAFVWAFMDIWNAAADSCQSCGCGVPSTSALSAESKAARDSLASAVSRSELTECCPPRCSSVDGTIVNRLPQLHLTRRDPYVPQRISRHTWRFDWREREKNRRNMSYRREVRESGKWILSKYI